MRKIKIKAKFFLITGSIFFCGIKMAATMKWGWLGVGALLILLFLKMTPEIRGYESIWTALLLTLLLFPVNLMAYIRYIFWRIGGDLLHFIYMQSIGLTFLMMAFCTQIFAGCFLSMRLFDFRPKERGGRR